MSSPGLQISVKAAEEANVLAKKGEDKAIEGAMSEEEVEELETLQYSLMSSPGLQISIKADEANVLARTGEQEWRHQAVTELEDEQDDDALTEAALLDAKLPVYLMASTQLGSTKTEDKAMQQQHQQQQQQESLLDTGIPLFFQTGQRLVSKKTER